MSWHKWWSSSPRASRRAFLGGAAATLVLPALESVRQARAGKVVAPVRTVFWYVPNGMVMDAWRPPGAGALPAVLPPILAPLAAHRDDILVVSGLANRPVEVPQPGDHAQGTGGFLTCREVLHTAGTDVRNGISIDQVIASEVGDTPFSSLELGTTAGSSVGDCDSGYSCAYVRNIAWLDEDTPKPKQTDPQLVFNRLFSGYDLDLTASEAERRRVWRTSVLDHVLEDASELEPQLSRSDRNKLDEFMTGVRELELRILGGSGDCAPTSRPVGRMSYADTVRAMTDLMVVALECDLTRVITFMMENGGSYRSFDFLGVTGAHHELSHHQGVPWKLESLTTIDAWEVEQFAYLVQRLGQTTDVDGASLLDNTVAMLSSEISDGDWHNHDDLPVLVAGRGGGAVTPGRHLVLPAERPIADLFLGIAGAAGVDRRRFGEDGRRPLALS